MGPCPETSRHLNPTDWWFDPDRGIWRGPDGEEIPCCERCGAFPYITRIDRNDGPEGEPDQSSCPLCQYCDAMDSYPEGRWAQTGL